MSARNANQHGTITSATLQFGADTGETGKTAWQWMRIFSLLALVALGVHAWVGMWTISTDYLTPMALGKWATIVRFLFQATCGIAMFTFFVWGVQILWGI